MSVIKFLDALEPDYLPEQLPGREAETKEIALALKPALDGRAPQPLFIQGRTGVGKTCSVHFVCRQLESASKAKTVFINCWQSYTRQSVLSELARSVGEALPRRGIAADEVFQRITQACKKQGIIPVVVLDEVDQLLVRGEDGVLYDLVRAHEIHGVPIGVVCITNDANTFAAMDERVRTSFIAGKLEFKAYSPKELREIVRDRVKKAFQSNAVEEEVIGLCTARAAKEGGDARVAIHLLLAAGRRAEAENADKVKAKHVPMGEANASQEKKFSRLNDTEEKILELIDTGKSSGELYEAVKKAGLTLSDRSVRTYLDRLVKKGFLKFEEKNEKGRTRYYERA
jgi:cell division control protein 6